MNFEQQVCNLKLAKKFEKLGVKQESAFYWCRGDGWNDRGRRIKTDLFLITRLQAKQLNDKVKKDCISAFTVAELGEILPKKIKDYRLQIEYREKNSEWKVGYVDTLGDDLPQEGGGLVCAFADTEADARAKMLIYLLENNLIKI